MIARIEGHGTPLVLIHGFGVDHRIMLPLGQMVEGRPWQRIYLDLPWAEGAADSGARSPREVADEVIAEVRGHLGDARFAVIGQSFGAGIARALAHSSRGACLGLATIAGVFEFDRAARTLPVREVIVADPAVVAGAGEARDEFAAYAVIQNPETLLAFEHYVMPGLRGADQGVVDRLSADYTNAYVPEIEEAPFTAPSLHVFGRQDHEVGFDDGLSVRAHYPRGTFAVLDAAGHNVHLERPAIVGALVTDWLDRMESAMA